MERKIFTLDFNKTCNNYGDIQRIGNKPFRECERQNIKEYIQITELTLKKCDYVSFSSETLLDKEEDKYYKDIVLYLIMRAYQLNKPVYMLCNTSSRVEIRRLYPFVYNIITDNFVDMNELIDHLNEI